MAPLSCGARVTCRWLLHGGKEFAQVRFSGPAQFFHVGGADDCLGDPGQAELSQFQPPSVRAAVQGIAYRCGGAYRLAFSTSNTFQTVGILHWVAPHLADLCASTAADAFF